MLGMTPAKQGNWETVGSKSKSNEDRKKRQAEQVEAKPKGKGKGPNGKGRDDEFVPVANGGGVFAEFDRAYAQEREKKAAAEKAAAAVAAAAAAAAPQARSGFGFAHLTVEGEKLVPKSKQQHGSGSDDSDQEGSPTGKAAAAGSDAAGKEAASKKPKAPKAAKKPRVGVAQVAAGIDVAVIQEVIAGLQQRYATNEASQVEVLADNVAKMFKEAQIDLPKALATKPLERCVGIPLDDLPPAIANALASFCSSVSDAALAEVGVALLAAVAEVFPTDVGQQQQQQVQQAQRQQQAGLLIMLATMLRARPGALVLAAPQLLAQGRALTAPGRLPLLLWVLSQAAASEPAAAVGAWVRVVLPQCLGAPLPYPGAKGASTAPAAGGAAPQVPRLDAASQEAAVQVLEGLLQQIGGSADVALGGGLLEPAVPGAAVEALARSAVPLPADAAAGGGKGGKSNGVAAAEALAARLHAPLLAVAGASRASMRQQGEWLVLALETAGLSSAPADCPDLVTDHAAASIAACLASPSGEGTFEVWESKHKGQLRGSSRVLCTLARRPELLKPVLANRSRTDALRRLLAALPARHKSFLAAGKGWQAAAARASEGAMNTLRRRTTGWGGAFSSGASKGGKGAAAGSAASGGGGAVAAGVLAMAVATAGTLVVAATYRREVAGVVQHYAGRPAAEALDASLLAPLNAALAPARAALAPHLAAATEALAPYADELQRRLEPFAAQAGEVWKQVVVQAQEIYAKAAHQ